MVNYRAIKAQMILKDVSQIELAEAVGVTPTTLRHKLSNVRPMLLTEARVIQKKLEIADADFNDYFFSELCHSDSSGE